PMNGPVRAVPFFFNLPLLKDRAPCLCRNEHRSLRSPPAERPRTGLNEFTPWEQDDCNSTNVDKVSTFVEYLLPSGRGDGYSASVGKKTAGTVGVPSASESATFLRIDCGRLNHGSSSQAHRDHWNHAGGMPVVIGCTRPARRRRAAPHLDRRQGKIHDQG